MQERESFDMKANGRFNPVTLRYKNIAEKNILNMKLDGDLLGISNTFLYLDKEIY